MNRGVVEGWTGRWLEDFEIGDIYRCRYGRTVTETENIQFTMLTGNTNQLHFNRHFGAASGWGKCLVNSTLTLAIVVGMSVPDVSENGFNLGWREISLPHPVFPGDTLYVETEVLGRRDSASRAGQGIVEVRTRGYNQDGVLVITFDRSIMVWRRNAAPRDGQFPVLRTR